MTKSKYILLIILLIIFLFSCQAGALHLPDVKKGLAIKIIDRTSITPTIALEIYEIDFSRFNLQFNWGFMKGDLGKWFGTWAVDGGIGNDLLFLSFSKILVPVIELQLGVFWGYDFDRFDGGFETGFIVAAILW